MALESLGTPSVIRVPLPVALVPVAISAALAVVLAAGPSRASTPRATCALHPITARTSIAGLVPHFGSPTWSRFRAGAQTDLWVSRRHDWTLIRYVHLRPRPNTTP